MVRALAGDSTMTRFFDTAGSVAPAPSRTLTSIGGRQPSDRRARRARSDLADAPEEVLVDLEALVVIGGCGLWHRRGQRDLDRDLELGADERPRRDLDEPDVEVREEEDRIDGVDEHRALAVEGPHVRAADAQVDGRRQLEQVDDDRLLVVEVKYDVSDHGAMVGPRPRRLEGPDGPV